VCPEFFLRGHVYQPNEQNPESLQEERVSSRKTFCFKDTSDYTSLQTLQTLTPKGTRNASMTGNNTKE